MTIKDEGMRRYRSIEDVKTTLKIRKVFLPSYFPQHLKWPPSEIYAQAKPYTVALMHFNDQNTGEIVLAIRQADSREEKPLRSRIEPEKIKSREAIDLKGRAARLSLASCGGGEPCSSVTWQEESYTLTVTSKTPARELIQIAESMITE